MGDEIKTQLPPADFNSLLYMLGTSALVGLGAVPDPTDQQVKANLGMAKYNIDLLGILQKKTMGNLDPKESKLLDELLYDLRMKYVRATTQNENQ
jgi:hypothetical protein